MKDREEVIEDGISTIVAPDPDGSRERRPVPSGGIAGRSVAELPTDPWGALMASQGPLIYKLAMANYHWAQRGSVAIHQRARAVLGEKVFKGPFDAKASLEFQAGPLFRERYCYWNAARLVRRGRDLERATYVEGIVVSAGFANLDWRGYTTLKQSLRLMVDWQGWLELDGRTIDPTTAYKDVATASGPAGPIYLPMAKFTREQVADQWTRIPLTLTDSETTLRSLEETHLALDRYIALAGPGPFGAPGLSAIEAEARRLAGLEE